MEKNPLLSLITTSAKPTLLQNWIAGILLGLFQKIWAKFDEAQKRFFARELAEKMVDEKLAIYRQYNAKLQEEIDQLKATGKTMSKERRDQLHKDKERLELDLWNSKP